jgi:transcriptional regulator with XRE-family HTH domain
MPRPYFREFQPNLVPPGCHPLVRRLYEEMNARRMSITEMAERSGVPKTTISQWRTRHNPVVPALEACFNAMGMALAVAERAPSRRSASGFDGKAFPIARVQPR